MPTWKVIWKKKCDSMFQIQLEEDGSGGINGPGLMIYWDQEEISQVIQTW